MKFIPFFKSSLCRIVTAARNKNQFCPPKRSNDLSLLLCLYPSSLLQVYKHQLKNILKIPNLKLPYRDVVPLPGLAPQQADGNAGGAKYAENNK